MYSSCRAWRPRPSAALQCEKSVAEARETAVLRAAMRLNMEGGGFVGVLGVLGVPGLGRWPNNWWATSERASLRELLLLLAATATAGRREKEFDRPPNSRAEQGPPTLRSSGELLALKISLIVFLI